MKRKAISRILAISLSVAMCAQSIPIYAAEEIGTSAVVDFFAEDSIENQSLNEGDAETNTETNTETNAESNTETNTETNMKADATTGISEAYTLEESNSATTSEETVTDKDGFWSGESETVESSANGSDGWESAEMNGAEAGDEAIKRDAAAFVSGDVEENVEETGETNELEEALSESAEMTEGDFSYVIVNNSYAYYQIFRKCHQRSGSVYHRWLCGSGDRSESIPGKYSAGKCGASRWSYHHIRLCI